MKWPQLDGVSFPPKRKARGRPLALDYRQQQLLKQEIDREPNIPLWDLRLWLQEEYALPPVTARTLNNYLHRNLHYSYRVLSQRPSQAFSSSHM